MISRFKSSTAKPLATIIAVTTVLGCMAGLPSMSLAQKKPKTRDCALLEDKGAFAAFAKAHEAFAGRWLRIGQHWFQSYELKGNAKHPLLPSPKDAGVIKGFVWLTGVTCQLTLEDPKQPVWSAKLMAGKIRFSEDGNPWTKPFSDGAIWEIFIANENGKWVVEDNSVETSILSPDASEKKPTPDELPPRKP